jgi:AcrR family transcriptional regulator
MPPATARARVRAELTNEILDAARRQLAEKGSASLSLRAVAREVGMVSSAVYRYFPSRDELLTALIVDAYNSLGQTVERAERRPARAAHFERWTTICRTVRSWALAHPHEYSLIYGSPVPGYQAPVTTIGPATRVALVLVQLVTDAQNAGTLADLPSIPYAGKALARDLDRLQTVFSGVPEGTIVRALVAWASLYGTVSFELFGQFHNVIDANADFFAAASLELAAFVGLPVKATNRTTRRRTG